MYGLTLPSLLVALTPLVKCVAYDCLFSYKRSKLKLAIGLALKQQCGQQQKFSLTTNVALWLFIHVQTRLYSQVCKDLDTI